MAVPVPALRLRPLTLMDVLDESFRLYRANFPLLAGLAIGLVIPVLSIQLVSGGYSSFGPVLDSITNPSAATPNITPPNPFISLLQYPVQLALVPFQAGGLFAAAVAIVLGTPTSFRSVLRTVLRRYWGLWAISFLYFLASAAILCPPLGIWLLTRLSMMIPVLFTESAPIGTAVERSWRLTEHAFWRTFGLLTLSLILAYVVQGALAGVFVTAAALFPGLATGLKIVLIVGLASLMTQLVQPLVVLAITLLYFDLRVRKEAFDLELMAYQLALSPGAAS
jgi:membrane-anchored glycerophosphoryl diester phosphodiesterase (GDPDase)